MPFAALSLGDAATSSLRYVILAAGPLAMLAFAALLVHKEKLAIIAVACSAVLPLALRRVSAIALGLIPVMVLSATPLHSTKLGLIAVGLLALATVARVCTGSLRVRSAHLWVAVLIVMVLLAYLFPADPLVSGGEIRDTLIWTIGGLLVLTVCIASPPATSALLGVILVTGAISGVVASAQRDYVEGRLQGLGLNPNYLAIYLAVPIIISIGLTARHRNLLWLAPAAACLPALLATKSRSGFLALAAGVVFLIIQGRPPRQKMLIALISVFTVLAVLVFKVNLTRIDQPGRWQPIDGGTRLGQSRPFSDRVVRAAYRAHPPVAGHWARAVPAVRSRVQQFRHLHHHDQRVPAAGLRDWPHFPGRLPDAALAGAQEKRSRGPGHCARRRSHRRGEHVLRGHVRVSHRGYAVLGLPRGALGPPPAGWPGASRLSAGSR